jgi:hypothetical protein
LRISSAHWQNSLKVAKRNWRKPRATYKEWWTRTKQYTLPNNLDERVHCQSSPDDEKNIRIALAGKKWRRSFNWDQRDHR